MLKIVLLIFLICFLSAIFVCSEAGLPAPDTTTECLSCQAQVAALDVKWSNTTTVAEILLQLDQECIQKYSSKDPLKVKLCKDIANVIVQIPPSLFQGMEDLAWPVPEALCATIFKCHVSCCAENDPPEQIHLSLASDDLSVMGVTWVTLSDKLSVVQYSESDKNWEAASVGKGSITTYKAAGWVGTIHRATMIGLKESTTYYYRVGNGLEKWSEVHSFTTLHRNQPLTFAVIADMDFDSNATIANLNALASSGKINAVIHSGDESYADGYEPHWDVFFNRIQPCAATVPYMASPGNHEFWYNFTSFKHRFFLPGVVDAGGSGDNMFYSWNAGFAHFISGNSETAVDTANFSDEFLAWLEADLAKVDRSVTPHVIVHFHRPMYCSNSGACTDKGGDHLRKQAEDIFYKNNVTLVISGHVHSYEVTYPVYQSQPVQQNFVSPAAPVYVMQGAAGNREGNDNPNSNPPAWSYYGDGDVGFALMTIDQTSIAISYYKSRADADGGPVLKNSFTMTF